MTAVHDTLATTDNLAKNPAAVYLAGLTSPESRRTMLAALLSVARILWPPKEGGPDGKNLVLVAPWRTLDYAGMVLLRTKLTEHEPRLAHSTINLYLTGVRGVLRAAKNLGQISWEHYSNACEVRNVKGSRLPAGRALAPEERAELAGACDQYEGDPLRTRDVAILAVLYLLGLRRRELCGLNFEAFDWRTGKVVVTGKGRKQRTLWLPDEGLRAVRPWLRHRGADEGPLFYACTPQGEIDMRYGEPRGISPATVFEVLRRLSERSGIEHARPHDMRRTNVSDLLDAGIDLPIVARLLGHSSVNTTAIYDRRPEYAARGASRALRLEGAPMKVEDDKAVKATKGGRR